MVLKEGGIIAKNRTEISNRTLLSFPIYPRKHFLPFIESRKEGMHLVSWGLHYIGNRALLFYYWILMPLLF
jgi:hypothetical protein